MSGVLGTNTGRKMVYFSLVPPLDPYSDPKYKPHLHMMNHHDRLFMIDLDAAQSSLEYCQTTKGSECLVLRHSSVRVTHKDHRLKDESESFGKEEYKEEGSSSTKQPMRPRTAEGNLLA